MSKRTRRRLRTTFAVISFVALEMAVISREIHKNAGDVQVAQPSGHQKVQSIHPYHYVMPHSIREVADPLSILVLVNPWNRLSAKYVPPDLVRLPIPFLNPGDPENHMMRKVAVPAFMRLYEVAQKDGIYFAGVSAFRSYATQAWIYNNNIHTEGLKLTELYSAKPGTSDHQTGLAIDLSGSSGQYATLPQFANTPEGKWLAAHAAQFGFIIRYPKGMQKITGYNYEPWHIRYVGIKSAKVITEHHWTLEQYLKFTSPVSKIKSMN